MPIDLLVLGAAFLSGLFGGGHCLVMCGGLATTLSVPSSDSHRFGNALLLNVGRIAGYVVAGVVVGGFGAALLGIARITALASTLRALIGAVMILVALRMILPKHFAWLNRAGGGLWLRLRPWRDRLVPRTGSLRPVMLGLFWGWLPCGLSTTLLAAAWLEASALHGGLLMLAFGIGTLPLMTVLSWSGAHFAQRLAQPGVRATAAGLIAMAGLLTLAAPWLVAYPAAHGLLQALGCRAAIGD